ncbi:MAG: DUF1398 family protein [Acidobacteriaceae bacterium]
MNKQVLEDCDRLAFENKLNFPESLQRMAADGVERYRADLARLEKMHYSANGDALAIHMPLENPPAIAEEFNESGVKAALKAIQNGKIDYGEFLRQIMQAGVAEYGVWLRGRKAIYFGRAGEFYVESFPGTK